MSARRQRKPSHIPLFVDSYLADTTHLSTEQHGAYFLLLMAAWRQDDCTLPDDAERLARIAKLPARRWDLIGPAILEMWTRQGGRIFQKRLVHEWHWVREKSEKSRAAVGLRRDRQASENNGGDGYGRNTNDVTNGLHQGGGGGPYQGATLASDSPSVVRGPFGRKPGASS